MESTVELVFTKHFEAQISGKSGFLDLLALESYPFIATINASDSVV